MFGIATHAALPMLNYSYFGYMNDVVSIIHMTIRIALVGFVCLIISHRKYFFTSWIWYFGFHMLIRTIVFFLPLLLYHFSGETVYTAEYTVNGTIDYFSRFSVDAFVFAIILVCAIMFEKGVLNARQPQEAT